MSVVGERREKAAIFILSLPVSPRDYVTSKVISNFTSFFVPWLIMTLSAVALFDATPLPNGMIPFSVAVLGFVFLYYCVLLGTALLTDSQAWHTVLIITGNIGINLFIPYLIREPSVQPYFQGETAVWGPHVTGIVVGEMLGGMIALGLAWYLSTRKKDFI